MATGRVLWFNATRGHGFIRPSDSVVDVFVNLAAVQAAKLEGLTAGAVVRYDIAIHRGTASAVNLRLE